MLQETILNYKLLVDNLGNLIQKSGYRNDFIAEKIGLKPTTFSVKKQRAKWTQDEVLKVLNIIDNEDVEDYYLGLLMQQVTTGPDDVLTLNEFKKQVKWK